MKLTIFILILLSAPVFAEDTITTDDLPNMPAMLVDCGCDDEQCKDPEPTPVRGLY